LQNNFQAQKADKQEVSFSSQSWFWKEVFGLLLEEINPLKKQLQSFQTAKSKKGNKER
jgi:hypothetical protein